MSRPYLRRWDLRSTARVDQFIAIANNMAAKIERIYGRSAKVIYPPVDFEKFHLADKLQPYYLTVSALVPYKRIDLAIDAFNALKLPLKIAGDGPLRKFLQRRAKANIEFRKLMPKYMLRYKVKAGMTGWAQVNGWRGNSDLETRIAHDLDYIEDRSLWRDVRILSIRLFRGFLH